MIRDTLLNMKSTILVGSGSTVVYDDFKPVLVTIVVAVVELVFKWFKNKNKKDV